jgi:tetratricopeptide (TPR) repeat protein
MVKKFKIIVRAIFKFKSIFKLSLASWWLMEGKVEKALPIFESLTQKYPNDGPILAMMGMALIKKGETEKGVTKLKDSLNLIQQDDKHLSEIYAYLGYGSLLIHNYDDALKFNSLALKYWDEVNIEFPKEKLYENSGIAYEKKGQLDSAIKNYNKGLEISPQDSSLYIRLARAYYLVGKYNVANKKLKELLFMDPTLSNDATVKQLTMVIEKEIKKSGGKLEPDIYS